MAITFDQVRDRLREVAAAHYGFDDWECTLNPDGRVLWIRFRLPSDQSLTEDMRLLAKALGTDSIDVEGGGCDTCGHGTEVLIRKLPLRLPPRPEHSDVAPWERQE